MKKYCTVFLKCTLAFAALYIVYQKADINQIVSHIQGVEYPYIILSFVVLNAAQIVSAFRMRYYFESAGQPCSRYFAIALYYIGMFFNTLLPGGIGGDGYKIWAMSKLEHFPKMTSFRLMLSNRASGLFLLLLLTFLLAFFSPSLMAYPYALWLLLACILLVIPGYFISARWLLKEKPQVALEAAKYSFVIQGCCLLSALLLFIGMGMDMSHIDNTLHYLILFMISSIVSVLPISIGGVGLREITFLYGAEHLQLNPSFGIAFSLVYFAINTVLSLGGLIFLPQLHSIHHKHKEHYHGSAYHA